MTLMDARDFALYALTFWRRTATRKGITLTLRQSSRRVRYALLTDYECNDARLCRRFISPSDRVLELGTAIGFLALYCRKIIGVEQITLVEANPNLLPLIAENFALNELEVPQLLNVAAGGGRVG